MTLGLLPLGTTRLLQPAQPLLRQAPSSSMQSVPGHTHYSGLPWWANYQHRLQGNPRRVRPRPGRSVCPRPTHCHGFITLRDLRHFRPSRRYRLNVQARTSAGVTSSIALIPEEDHDEQDEQQDQVVRTLRPGCSYSNWSNDGGTASSRGRSHRHSVLRPWLGLRQRPNEP